MLGTKNPILCNRLVYNYKGKWKNPNNDYWQTIYYFISTPMTLVSTWENGREQVKSTLGITVFGEHAFCTHDIIRLQDGTEFEVQDLTNNYFDSNIQVRDMVKQRVESQEVTLD